MTSRAPAFDPAEITPIPRPGRLADAGTALEARLAASL